MRNKLAPFFFWPRYTFLRYVAVFVSASVFIITADLLFGHILAFLILLGGLYCFFCVNKEIQEASPYKNTSAAILSLLGGMCCASMIVEKLIFDCGIHGCSKSLALLGIGLLLAFSFFPVVSYVSGLLRQPLRAKLQTLTETSYSYGVMIATSLGAILIQVIACFNFSLGLDESYTLRFIAPGFSEMIKWVAADVHPPLYYILVKCVVELGRLAYPEAPLILLAKLASVLPFVLLVLLGVTTVRRTWGRYVSGVFCLSVFSFSPVAALGCDMRMYGWALLFVTLTYVYSWHAVHRADVKSWSRLILFSLCTAYTHYFAIVAVLPAFAYVLFSSRAAIKPWLISCSIIVLLYMPWLLVFIRQVSDMGGSYWIGPITEFTVLNMLSCVYGGGFLPLFILLLAGIFQNARKWHDLVSLRTLSYEAITVTAPLFVIVVGVTVSFILHPVFIVRYMLPALVVMMFGIALIVSRYKHSLVRLVWPLFLLASVSINCYGILRVELSESKEYRELMSMTKKLKYPLYIGREIHRTATASVMLDSPTCLWQWPMKTDPLASSLFELPNLSKREDVCEKLDAGYDVYYLATSETDVKRFAEDTGLNCSYVGDYSVAWPTKFYRITY